MIWGTVPLHAVATLESGYGFPPEHQGDQNQEFPFFRVSDMNILGNEVFMHNHSNTVSASVLKELGARTFPPGTVIFPKIGAAIGTEKKRILVKPSTYDNNVMGAVPKEWVNPKFLYYWFLQLKLADYANPGHVPSIRKSVMEKIPFPLLALSEQERIVELLDVADRLLRLRRQADAKASRILPLIFEGMFGKPFEDMRWDRRSMGELVTLIRNGTTADQNTHGAGFPVTRIETISAGCINPERVRYVDLSDAEVVKWRLQPGDILFSHINSEAHIGKTAIYVGVPEILVHGMNLLLLRPDPTKVEPDYLLALLNTSDVRAAYRSRCKRAVNQASLNQKDIASLDVPVPPMELQRRFSVRASLVLEVLATESHGWEKLHRLFNNLLRQALSGQLTAGWRKSRIKELQFEIDQQSRSLNLPSVAAV
jgi:type I restriction enzyme S subunit